MPTIVHIDIPADNTERANDFYSKLFGWKTEKTPGMDYYLVQTKGLDGADGPGGGIGKRQGGPEDNSLYRSALGGRVSSKSRIIGRKSYNSKDASSRMGISCYMHGYRE